MPLGDIRLSSNFSLSSQRPLDDRRTLDDIAERDALPFVRRYNLMRVDVTATGESFQLILGTADNDLFNNANWVETFGSMAPTDYYTILQLQGDGTAEVHWNNLTNIPDFSTTFLELDDTEADYSGHAGEVPIVNEAEDALEFGTINSGFVTVGTDGDYATINEAIADGKVNLKIISDITVNNVDPVYMNVIGDNGTSTKPTVSIEVGSGVSTTLGDSTAVFKNLKIRYSFLNNSYNAVSGYIYDCEIEQHETIGATGYATSSEGKLFKRCTFLIQTTTHGLYTNFQGRTEDCIILSTSATAFYFNNTRSSTHVNLKDEQGNCIQVNAADSQDTFIDFITVGGNLRIAGKIIGGIASGNVIFNNAFNAPCTISDFHFKGTLNILETNGNFSFVNCRFDDSVIISSSNVSFNACSIRANTITINATADKTILTNNRTATEIIDNGTNSIIQGNQLI